MYGGFLGANSNCATASGVLIIDKWHGSFKNLNLCLRIPRPEAYLDAPPLFPLAFLPLEVRVGELGVLRLLAFQPPASARGMAWRCERWLALQGSNALKSAGARASRGSSVVVAATSTTVSANTATTAAAAVARRRVGLPV